MFPEKSITEDFWCPAGQKPQAREPLPALDMSAADWAALSRFTSGDWVSDAHIDRLLGLGLVEKVFGQALLTRLGRTTIGVPG
jgi:hypothetical protein